MKSSNQSRLKSKTDELVDDLNAVRAAVLSKQQGKDPEAYARLEPRLFESWIIERLARTECRVSGLEEELEQLRQGLATLRQNLPRGSRKPGKTD